MDPHLQYHRSLNSRHIMSTTNEYKDGDQSAPQWKPAAVWGANHAHGPEAAYHKDDAEAYNLHGSP